MTHKKQNLPEKICVSCRRQFVWRKKWERVWDEVKYCSDRCRRAKKKAKTEVGESAVDNSIVNESER